MNPVKDQPLIYEPGKTMNCSLGGNLSRQDEPKDDIWLTRFHTIRNYAIRRVIDKELPLVQKAFMRSAKFGAHCTALLRTKEYHRETVAYLNKMGFTFMPALEMAKNRDGSCIYYHACLPVACEDKKMNGWICKVREVYFKAQKLRVERYYTYIKEKFEKAAKKRKSTIVVHENYCRIGGELVQVIEQRIGCQMQKHQNEPRHITLTIPDLV